jgi:hypothetical protein
LLHWKLKQWRRWGCGRLRCGRTKSSKTANRLLAHLETREAAIFRRSVVVVARAKLSLRCCGSALHDCSCQRQ